MTLSGDVRGQGVLSTINGHLSLGGSTRTFDVDLPSGLASYADIRNGGSLSHPGLIKSGGGILLLAGANTFSGAAQLERGSLELGHDSALGASQFFGTSVAAGAVVRVLDGVDVPSEQLNLNGGGLYAECFSTWGGRIVLNTNSHIRSLLAGKDFRITGGISGPGGFTHAGHERLTLAGTNANTFSGAVTLTEGDLWLAKLNNQVSIPGALMVGNPGNTNNENTVRLDRANQIADDATVTLLESGVMWFV